jgi:Leucine-rich repeat (LRR) protein
MAHNEITSLPDSIANLPRLEIIDLNHNRIGPHLPSGMESLTALRKLHMDHNQLVSLPPTLMMHWQKLADLSLAHNRLSWFLAGKVEGRMKKRRLALTPVCNRQYGP